ncbi:MAG: DUF4234 domain-containing protein [Gammaproteobacteria bacterium]|nr:DUF4234 domain-containing protein [Gammaproteobacteria bacterium]
MSTITDLKDQVDTKTLNFVLLSIATAGIYPILWLYNNFRVIDNVTGAQTANNNFIIWIAVCMGLSGAFSGNGDETLDVIGGILSIAGGILYIVWAFRARKALQEYALNEHKIDLRMNGFYTFGFNVYYINYCINDLPEAHRKQQILSSHQDVKKS